MKIILNTNLFTNEVKKLIEPQLETLIKGLSASLDIKSLKQVIVPANFTEEIIEFQKAHDKKEIGHRDTDGGTAVAKVISYNELTNYSQVIFLHEGLIASLLIEEGDSEAIHHYIQHELGHIHDYFCTRDIFTQSLINGNEVNKLQSLLLEHSEIIWSEYYANRTSFPTANFEIILNAFQNVIDNLESVKEKSREYIDKYLNNGDTIELIDNLRKSTDLLFYYTAHSFGFLHPLRETLDDSDDLEEINHAVMSHISKTFYLETWNKLDNSLLKLYKKYPNWNGINELDELNEIVLQCWEALGVEMYMQGSQLCINVQ